MTNDHISATAGMPKVPEVVTIDLKANKLYVDGVEFPFMIVEEPRPDTYNPKDGHLPSVLVRFYAGSVQVVR